MAEGEGRGEGTLPSPRQQNKVNTLAFVQFLASVPDAVQAPAWFPPAAALGQRGPPHAAAGHHTYTSKPPLTASSLRELFWAMKSWLLGHC